MNHGGNLGAAVARFGLAANEWEDLSTGISPWSWPVPVLPDTVWRSLPDGTDRLEEVAASYFRASARAVLAVPGSQFALRTMPSLLPTARVAVPQCGYAEHAAAWRSSGHPLHHYADGDALLKAVKSGDVDYAVVINPNNPTGEWIARDRLQEVHAELAQRGGCLFVDEAFVDTCPERSMAGQAGEPGLVVYRSMGKFFGLAGLRLGFVLAPPELCERLTEALPVWAVSHPARWIGERALQDDAWIGLQRRRLLDESTAWRGSLVAAIPELEFVVTSLFVSGTGDAMFCKRLYNALGRRGVLVRRFERADGVGMLRFGLPPPSRRGSVVATLTAALEDVRCA